MVAKPADILWERFIAGAAIGLWATLTFRQLAVTAFVLNAGGLVVVLTHNAVPIEATFGWTDTAIGECLAPRLFHAGYSRILREHQQGILSL